MPVDPNIHLPIYQQIVVHVCGAVAAGVFRPGESLPSIRALALELTVNPNTVQRAYQELERKGLLFTRRGLGAFVAEDGHESARASSEAVVRARFSDGIQVGYGAKMPAERIHTIFRNALKQAGNGGRAGGGTTSHVPPSREDEP